MLQKIINMSSDSAESCSGPDIPTDSSKGSSVSSGYENEYDELLKYAIVAPKLHIADDVYPRIHKRPELATILEVSQGDASFRTGNLRPAANGVDNEKDFYSADSEGSPTAVQNLPSYSSMSRSGQVNNTGISTHGAISLEALLSSTKKDTEQHQSRRQPERDIDSSPATSSADTSATLTENTQREIDQDLLRMDQLMDNWCSDLKNNVMSEFSSCKLKHLENHREQVYILKRKHADEIQKLVNENESLRELLHSYELSVKQKDTVINNLTGALQKQREKTDKVHTFCSWRLQHTNDRREVFASKLAYKHHQRNLIAKVWTGWRSVVETKWKLRVEKACQSRAQEVCVQLTEDYETRINALQRDIEEARGQVAKMHCEREAYEETMKKAFMRGVCALNMEAMQMFHEGQGDQEDAAQDNRQLLVENERLVQAAGNLPTSSTSTHQGSRRCGPSQAENQQQQQYVQRHGNAVSSTGPLINKGKGKRLTIHATGKSQLGAMGQNRGQSTGKPSVASVLVQRHVSSQQPGSSKPRQLQDTTNKTQARLPSSSNAAGIPAVKVVE